MVNLYLKVVWVIRRLIFSFLDLLIRKNNCHWVFPVYFIGEGRFSDNMLAVFMQVKDDKDIKKIILTRDVDINVSGVNVHVVPMSSYKAAYSIIRANVVFVQHSIWLDFSKAKFQMVNPLGRHIVNLWHGVSLKNLGHENTGIHSKRSEKEMACYRMITSSVTDRKNMQLAFKNTDSKNFWITGLPRNDFVIMEESCLPSEYLSELKYIDEVLKGRRLILYAPTYRESTIGSSYYFFSDKELDNLELFCRLNNCVIGFRYHIYRPPEFIDHYYDRNVFIDLSDKVVSDVRLLLRRTSLLITDYSSVFLDALYANVLCISFAYDKHDYDSRQRGFFYSYDDIFKYNAAITFEELFSLLLVGLSSNFKVINTDHDQYLKSIFFEYIDDKNSKRVVECVKELVSV